MHPLLIGLVDSDDFDGPPPSITDRDRALRALDAVEVAIERARAILLDGTIGRLPTGLALDAVVTHAEDLTDIAFDLHGMG